MTLVVRNWRVEQREGGPRMSADIGDFNVWIQLPPGAAPGSANSFLAFALVPAMAAHVDIDLTALPPVCPELLSRLELMQDIWTTWNPLLERVRIRSTPGLPEGPMRAGGAAFFSGGIDALFSALACRDQLDQLVLVNGFDFDMSAQEFVQARARVARQADHIGLPLVSIETNWIEFTRHHRIARLTTYGSALAGFGHALSPERMTIGSSSSYARLSAMGSHPLLDPLWSSAATRIYHHGCVARRDEKLEVVARHPELIADIWVCHRDPVRNCGECPKCLRLRLAMALMDREHIAFPAATGDAVAAWCRVARYRSERIFFTDFIEMAMLRGKMDAARKLSRAAQGIRLLTLARKADAVLLGGAITRWRQRGEESTDLMPWGRGAVPEA